MKKKVVCLALTTALAATCCAAILTACGDNKDENVGFDKTTVFHVDLTMSTAIGPLSTLCNPGTITFEPDGKAKMNLTFTDSAIVMMDNLLGFRISNFVHNDTYELNEDETVITYHSTRKYSDRDELVFGDMEIPIEYLSDNSMKFTFDIGKAIPDTVLYFYSNEAMMPKPEEPEEPVEPETFTLSYDINGGVLAEDATLPEAKEFEEATEITLPKADFTKEGYLFRGWAIYGIEGLGLWQPGDKYTVKSDVKFVAVWDETATFTFTDGNGLSQSFEAKIGESIRLPECMFASNDVKKGFGYWLQEGNTVKKYPGDTISVKTDTVFTANFTELINLTFTPGEGAGAPFVVTIPAYSKYIIPECAYQTPSADKGFGGWKAGYSTYKPGDKSTAFKQDTELVAQWKGYITIKFDKNGGTGDLPENISVVNGMYFVLPESTLTAPENTRFGGWSTSATKASSVKEPGETASQTKNTTYYALWDMMRTVSFDTGIDGKTVESVTQYERDKIVLPEMPYEKEGKRFAGWNKTQTATYGTVAGSSYSVPAGSDTTLYAIWDDYVEVSFAGGDGATGTMEAIGAYERDKVVLPECTFEKEGYVFDCWTDGKKDYEVGKEYTVPQNGATFTAKWLKIETITLTGGDGATGSMDPMTGAETKTIILPECTFTKAGYSFGGWKDSTDTVYEAGATYTVPTGGATLTVNWMESVAVKFVGGDGATGSMSDIFGAETKTVVLPDCTFVKDGFAFGGWKDASGNVYAAGEKLTLPAKSEAASVTLTAVWVKGQFTPYIAVFRVDQSIEVNGTALSQFIAMSELKVKPNLTADFTLKFCADEYLPGHAKTLGTTAEKLRAKEFDYKNVPYEYDAEKMTLTLKPEGADPIVLQLSKKAKNVEQGILFDQVCFTWQVGEGALEKIDFLAIDGEPDYLEKTTVLKAEGVKVSILTVDIELVINTDGTGEMRTSNALVGTLTFYNMFADNGNVVLWLGDTGAFVFGSVGKTEDGLMTITVTMQGSTVTVTEVKA